MTDVPFGMTRAVRRRRRWPYVAGAVGLVLAAAAGALLARTLQYRGETMPGVREAIEQKEYAAAETEIVRVAKALEREAALLDSISSSLQP